MSLYEDLTEILTPYADKINQNTASLNDLRDDSRQITKQFNSYTFSDISDTYKTVITDIYMEAGETVNIHVTTTSNANVKVQESSDSPCTFGGVGDYTYTAGDAGYLRLYYKRIYCTLTFSDYRITSESGNSDYLLTTQKAVKNVDDKVSNLRIEQSEIFRRLEAIDGIRDIDFELGNANVVSNELIKTNSTTRIRSVEPVAFSAGEILDIASGYQFYLHQFSNGTWTDLVSWKSAAYTIPVDGFYEILIRENPESTVTDVDDLASKLIVPIGDSIREDIDDTLDRCDTLENAISEINVGKHIIALTLTSGYIKSDGSFTSASANAEVYSQLIPVSEGESIDISLIYGDNTKTVWLAIGQYDSNQTFKVRREHDTQSIGSHESTYVVPSGVSYIRFTYRTYGNVNFSATTNLPFVQELQNQINDLSGGVLDFTAYHGTITSVDKFTKNIEYPNLYKANSIIFETNGSNYCGIQLTLTKFSIGSKIAVRASRNVGSSWLLRIDLLDANNQRIGGEVTTTGNVLRRIIPNETKKIEITIASNWATSLNSGTVVTFSDILVYYSEIEELQGSETGNTEYTGEKVSLTYESQKTHLCNSTIWKEYTTDNIDANIDSNKVFYLNQSMTIYGDYVFFFSENGGGAVASYATKELLSEFDSLPTTLQHHNSAQFSDIFYEDSDEFPLLFVSRCGNAAYRTGAYDYDEMLIYRIQRQDNAFTFTLVNSIKLDAQTYGTSWGVDNIRHRLYVAGPRNGNWQVPEGNVTDFWAFNEPTKAEIISGTEIVLHSSEALAYFRNDYFTLQGCAVNNGIYYCGVSAGTQYVWAVDVMRGRILSKIPMLINNEIEGVAIYNNKLYTSHKTSDHLWVCETVFN